MREVAYMARETAAQRNRPSETAKTYISLFSSAGVGCYGFKQAGFDCIATNELIERRLNIQKFNDKCRYPSGYVLGDITDSATKQKLLDEIAFWKTNQGIQEVDVVIATPPCQGMSVANHKKSTDEIRRNSLVVESIGSISQIHPKFFIFENVAAFMKTACTGADGAVISIGDAIHNSLGRDYSIYADIINFKNYGASSSRTRTLVIGVRRDLCDFVSPIELFPAYLPQRTLRETIGHLRPLTVLGEFDKDDIYHNFRKYPEQMRAWVSELTEGQSAFDNTDPLRIPHRVKSGEIVYNQNKNGDKYKRQFWDKVGPCIHTRNDQFASQNTIHPADDRVFSVRELMLMMTVPQEFRWTDIPVETLNAYSPKQKQAFMKREELKIRQSIGEAVPTAIFGGIAQKIGVFLGETNLKNAEIHKLIETHKLWETDNLLQFLAGAIGVLGHSTLCKIAELSNAKRQQHAAYFTNKSIVLEIVKALPPFDGQEIHILEPSVGVGNFLPFVAKKYAHVGRVHIDAIDIDPSSLRVAELLVSKLDLPPNIVINYICADFLTYDCGKKYDLVIGNPPFSKLQPGDAALEQYRRGAFNKQTTNTFSFFLEKAVAMADYVSLVTPKFLLNTPEFALTRKLLEKKKVVCIHDFGEHGFEGVLVETICISIDTQARPRHTKVISIPLASSESKRQGYIFDKKLPYWVIYRNDAFDRVCENMQFGIFTVFRDRQITKGLLKPAGKIRVLKSRNISDDGAEILDIPQYDSYIDRSTLEKLAVYKYFDLDNVYLTPNMTYNPRVIKKPKGIAVNGSLAILIPKNGERLTRRDMRYFSSAEYRAFYRVARNHQTRSLNVDSASVYFFGKRRG